LNLIALIIVQFVFFATARILARKIDIGTSVTLNNFALEITVQRLLASRVK